MCPASGQIARPGRRALGGTSLADQRPAPNAARRRIAELDVVGQKLIGRECGLVLHSARALWVRRTPSPDQRDARTIAPPGAGLPEIVARLASMPEGRDFCSSLRSTRNEPVAIQGGSGSSAEASRRWTVACLGKPRRAGQARPAFGQDCRTPRQSGICGIDACAGQEVVRRV